ncbi:MAG TPA: NrfD/PsrC family molybdoenzyme membrane anchor subunit [Pseudonocardiaceae bacterium]|nr:NrfD/PsrC family molybdoenzyme membrane anchor subunit [Pseudonocardiaceae bacterium]
MSESEVTRQGVRGGRPDREAITGAVDNSARPRRRKRGKRERPMVPDAEFTSYYGKPIINPPVWESPDIPGYLFLGGLAGLSSPLALGAQLTGRDQLARVAKCGATAAGALSLVALVHDLGRPERFLHMLRVVKITSPMNVGSWLLAGYVPAAGVAMGTALLRRLPRIGLLAGAGAAVLGPAVAAYTAALLSDTAVPAWHDGHRELPFVFVGSGATAAGGLGLLAAPAEQTAPARNLALFGAATELASFELMTNRMDVVAESYQRGKARKYVRAGKLLTAAGAAGALLGRRNRIVAALSGAALLAGSAATRWGIFHAGLISADDPKYTVVPQRNRLRERAAKAPS